MATTTNYSWTTPDDTDLVKDGASAIRTLGSSIDTTTKNLNPETTLGDISYRSSTANTNTRLGIGTTGQVLTVSGGVPAWATPSAGGFTSIASGTLSSTAVTISAIPTTYVDLYLLVNNPQVDSGSPIRIQIDGDTGNNYQTSFYRSDGTAISNTGATAGWANNDNISTSANSHRFWMHIPNYANTNINKTAIAQWTDGSIAWFMNCGSAVNGDITSLTITTTGGTSTFSAGTYTLYGVK